MPRLPKVDQYIPRTPKCGEWSIGIYTGPSPLDLSAPLGLSNPVLTADDITDLSAEFVADPFMVRKNNRWFMFFEIMPTASNVGVIGLAESHNGFQWRYHGVVLRESYHLSYPYVFSWRGRYYMTPETLAPQCIRLYQASRFPDRWEHVSDLIEGHHADPSVFRIGGVWFMFSCTPPGEHQNLRLYRAATLKGPWIEHPQSPIIQQNPHIARPAGRVIAWNGKLIRFTQNCSPRYGIEVRAYRIESLTATDYSEAVAQPSPIVSPRAEGWNGRGMHHVDAHRCTAKMWLAAVDGYN